MGPDVIGPLIPIFGIMCGMLAIWTRHQSKMAKLNIQSTAESTAERAAQYASKVQQLEDRVRVLERIVTDRGYDIATQIEALRDQRRVESDDAGVPLNVASRENV